MNHPTSAPLPDGFAPAGRIRWQIPAALFVSVIISYLDRNNLSLALPKIAEEFGWTAEQQGKYDMILFIAFFFSYGLANLLFSPFGEKYGPKQSITIAVICFSIFTILGGVVGQILPLFIVTRVLLGLGEGVHFPMNSKITKSWFPVQERSRANGMWIAGVMAAVILGPLILVPLTDYFGWRAMFVALGILSMAVTLPLLKLFVYNTPREHPRIGEAELNYIEAGMERDEAEGETFWQQIRPILKSGPFWVALTAGILNNAASYGLMFWLPSYFVEGRGLDYKHLAWATSLPYVFGVAGIALWSWLGDKLQKRAFLAGAGYLITAVIAYFAANASGLVLTIVLFSIAVLFQSAYTSQEFAILQRIIPKQVVGAGSGFYNGVAMMVGGVLGNSIVGGVVAATGDMKSGIVALLSTALLAGVATLVLSRLIKY